MFDDNDFFSMMLQGVINEMQSTEQGKIQLKVLESMHSGKMQEELYNIALLLMKELGTDSTRMFPITLLH